MKFKEYIVDREELMILLNILFKTDNDMFKIHPYLIEKEIFKVSLGKKAKIKRLIEKDEYRESTNDIEDLSEIVPEYKVLRKILISSGFWKMENWNEVITILNEIKKRNPLAGERATFIGMDTNCYINRVYSLIRFAYKKEISKFGFVLSRIIKYELQSARKISEEQLDELTTRRSHNEEIFQEFWNGETLQTRLKHIGLVEFRKLLGYTNSVINDGLVRDNKEHDIQIIEDFRRQIINQNHDLVLLSSDKQFYDLARDPGIRSYYLKLPYLNNFPSEFSGEWEQICDFLYLMSVFFGAISLRARQTIKIFGLWRGKTTEQWDDECVKLRIGSAKLIKLLDPQINIVRNKNS